MQDIEIHIAYLLTKHDCVIVPGLGAFVASFCPAVRCEHTGVLNAPHKSIGFNAGITHNDGLLVNAFAKTKGIAYNEAKRQIAFFVDALKVRLQDGETVRLDWVGTLSLSDENKLQFAASVQSAANNAYYGFSNFFLPSLSELEEDMYTPATAPVLTLEQPARRIMWPRIAVAAAAIALFLIPSNLNNPGRDYRSQTANVMDTYLSVLIDKPAVEAVVEATPELGIAAETVVVPEAETAPVEVEAIETLEPVVELPVVQPAPAVEKVAAVPTRRYFIVIASLPTRESADARALQYRKNGFEDAAVVSDGDKHRIYVQSFENKAGAQDYLEHFREQHPEHAKAWLLGQRI